MHDGLQHSFLIGEAYIHLGRMDIYVHLVPVDPYGQAGERILVLHQLVSVAGFNAERNDAALYVAAVHEIIFKIAVPAADRRLRDEAGHVDRPLKIIHRQKLIGHAPPVDMVEGILEISAARRGEAARPVLDEFKADIRSREGQLFNVGPDMGAFRGRRLQEFSPGRRIVEDIPDDDRCPVRGADLLKKLFSAALDHVAGRRRVLLLLGDELDAAHGCNRGKCLASKSQG